MSDSRYLTSLLLPPPLCRADMPTNSDSSSSLLRLLAQHNRSKSTVSSSDTDIDSAGYTSSSGTTTPEDDAQTFHLNPTCRNVLAEKPKGGARELTINTKHRNFASAVKKVKKVAHALATFKRKRPDDISPILISSPLRERFGKRMAVKPQPDESFYSLPNRRFSLSDVSAPPYPSQTITRKFGTISGSTSSFVGGSSRKQRSGLRIPSFSEPRQSTLSSSTPETEVPRAQLGALTSRKLLIHVLRILLFLPWCAAVGGALVLFPSYAGLVAFRTGYLASRKGIRRFAHWAECGQQHVMIFLACLVAVIWYNPALGLSLTSVVVSRFVFVWHAFKVDKSIPLGEDDQQSLYLVAMGLASTDGSFSVSRARDGRTVGMADDSVSAIAETKV
ncbi:hypothetical protein V8E55_009932 [Tylopilus felleus]